MVGASLRPGDVLKVTVWENPKLSGDFEVSTDSTLKHPLYNEIKVVGIPMSEVKARLTAFLMQFQREPRVELEPLLKVAVQGEVRTPNVYSVSPETTISDLIAQAGGPTESGSLNRVTIVRLNRRSTIDLTKTDLRLGQLTIRSGDQLVVGRRRSIMRDVIGPTAAVISSIASIAVLATR